MLMPTVLVTGAAGFIGSSTCHALLAQGKTVIGIDNFNSYYDVTLKRARAKRLEGRVHIIECDISDRAAIERVFQENTFDQVCHLAAQAGVRYSMKNPYAYESSIIWER